MTYLNVHKYRMTFWPRFAISRNDSGNLIKVKDMFTLRPALAQNLKAVLNVIVKFAGKPIFAIFCQDA